MATTETTTYTTLGANTHSLAWYTHQITGQLNGAGGKKNGGAGGYTEAEIDVSGYDSVEVYVGGADGTNGGGPGASASTSSSSTSSGNGGGASDIRVGGTTLSERAAVAAGGGGGGGADTSDDTEESTGGGGAGGASSGQDGGNASTTTYTSASGGAGGTQSGGNAKGDGGGGASATDGGGDFDTASAAGGGGGGGYYGGYGGGADAYGSSGDSEASGAGGGGGSNFVDTNIASTVDSTRGAGAAAGNHGDATIAVTRPDAPTNLSATGGYGQIDLDWDASPDTVDGYRIYRDTTTGVDPATATQVGEVGSNTTTFTDDGLADGATYYYVVTAFSPNESPASNEATATTNDVPPAPTNVSATAFNEIQIDLSWDPSDDAESYNIYRAQSTGTALSDYTLIDSTTNTSYSDDDLGNGLVNGRAYYYRVTAENQIGESDPSSEVTATTDLPASTLESLDGTAVDEVTAVWTLNDDNPDGTIAIRRRPGGDTTSGTQVESRTSLDDSVDFVDTTDLLDGDEYEYVLVRDTGDASTQATWTAVITVLPSVTDFSADSVSGRYVTLSWTETSDNSDGYRLYRLQSPDGSYTQDGTDIAPVAEGNTVTYETTELLDGEIYRFKVETFTAHTTATQE